MDALDMNGHMRPARHGRPGRGEEKMEENEKEIACLKRCYPGDRNFGTDGGDDAQGERCQRNYMMCVEFCHRKVRDGGYPEELYNDHIRQYVCR